MLRGPSQYLHDMGKSMKIDLAGKTAVITGSTQGIGFATASGLAEAGASVVINGREKNKVDKAVAVIRNNGGKANGVVADMGTAEGCKALVDAAPVTDILVSNAAFVGWLDFMEAGDDIWLQAWQTNVMTAARLSRHYLPGMKAKGWGRLVFISSESSRNIQPDLVPYGASKLALHALSRGIAKRMANTGVTSNVVLPGPTLSDGVKRMLSAQPPNGSLEEMGARFVLANRSSSVLKRMTTVDEVAAMAIYICSPLSSGTSGCVLRVDGGVIEDVN